MADRALDVATVLADRWEDHPGHPVLEGLGLRLVGAHHQLVEAALGDEPRLVRPTITQFEGCLVLTTLLVVS